MSTRTFKIGNAEVFQDKPSEETRRAVQLMHEKEYERCGLLVKKGIRELAEALSVKEDSELSAALNILVREVKKLKQNKDAKK